jgi:hypothetical protein
MKMTSRCHSETDKAFPNYGGRGIFVCVEWRGEGGFERFLAHVGARPSAQHSIDRIDNNLGYQPGNCRWATRHQQTRNKRTNRWLTIDGETMIQNDWARRTGVNPQTLQRRLKEGFPLKVAVRPGRQRKQSKAS